MPSFPCWAKTLAAKYPEADINGEKIINGWTRAAKTALILRRPPPKKTGRICRYDPEYVKLKSDER
jgi:hypothetical protein